MRAALRVVVDHGTGRRSPVRAVVPISFVILQFLACVAIAQPAQPPEQQESPEATAATQPEGAEATQAQSQQAQGQEGQASDEAAAAPPSPAQEAPAPAVQPPAGTTAAEEEGEGPIGEIDPILPEQGLFQAQTYVDLGRRLLENLVDYLPRLAAALIVLVLFLLLARVVGGVLSKGLGRTRADPALTDILTRLAKITIIALGCIMAAAQAGIQVGSLIAGVGVVGLAIGLAAQDSLGNVVAGLTILWDRPFKIGDMVSIADEYGEIRQIGLRTTRIRTVQQNDAILPNQHVIESKILNHSMTERLRLDVPLGIAYWEDVEEAREVLTRAVTGHPRITEEPFEIVVTQLGDSAVNLELRVWLKSAREERRTLVELLELSKKTLDQAGIEIPFHQHTLHLGKDFRWPSSA